MGIRGLTTYIYDRSDLYLKQYKLRDTQLVIDGFSLASKLYFSQQATCFSGGDYDVYYENVKNFFSKLKKCNIEAIVILDGAMEEKKFKTYFKRAKERLVMLRDLQRVKPTGIFFPLFKDVIFKNVLMELEIKHSTCLFEADQEIASLACFLNCPVLSCDSDFFIFGCLYIPIDMFDVHKINLDIDKKSASFYIDCKIYDIKNFACQFEGGKCMLPYLAALQGNDYVNCNIFHNFVEHISIHTGKTSYNKAKIKSLIEWLKNENSESAEMNIVKHLRKKDIAAALRAIKLSFASYEILTPKTLHLFQREGNGITDVINTTGNKILLKLPDKYVERYEKNYFSKDIIDMVYHNKYYPALQVEDVAQASSHCVSFPIISGLYYVASNLVGIKTKLKVMLKMNGTFLETELDLNTDHLSSFDANFLLSAQLDVKINFIYKVLSLDASDITIIELYDEDWRIVAMTIMYWLKNCSPELSHSQFRSMVLMLLGNFIQSRVGYFKSYSSFMKCKGGAMNRLSKKWTVVENSACNSFSDMLNSISEFEYLKFTEKFIKLRQLDRGVTENGYFLRTLHIFAKFQSILYHLMQLNELLGYPCPRTYVYKIYSGTFLYNLYYLLNKRKNLDDFIGQWLEHEPNVLRVYHFFVNTFSAYVRGEIKRENRTRPEMVHKGRGGKRSSRLGKGK